MTLSDRIAELARAYGSLRALGGALSLDVGYLSRLSSGEKSNPSDEVVRKLGLRKIVTITYERLGTHHDSSGER